MTLFDYIRKKKEQGTEQEKSVENSNNKIETQQNIELCEIEQTKQVEQSIKDQPEFIEKNNNKEIKIENNNIENNDKQKNNNNKIIRQENSNNKKKEKRYTLENNFENEENEIIENIKTKEGIINIYLIKNIDSFKNNNNINRIIKNNIKDKDLFFVVDKKDSNKIIDIYNEYFVQKLIWVYDIVENEKKEIEGIKYLDIIVLGEEHKIYNTLTFNRKGVSNNLKQKEFIINFLEREDVIYIEDKKCNINSLLSYINNIAFLKLKNKEKKNK